MQKVYALMTPRSLGTFTFFTPPSNNSPQCADAEIRQTREAVQRLTRIIKAKETVADENDIHPARKCLVKLHLLASSFYPLLACLIIPVRGFTKNNLYGIIIIIIDDNMFAWLTGTETTPPAFLEVRSSKWLIISTVAAAVFTDVCEAEGANTTSSAGALSQSTGNARTE